MPAAVALSSQADIGAAGVKQEELNEKGRPSDDFDESAQEPAQRRDWCAKEQGDREAERNPERAADAPAEHGHSETAEQGRQIAEKRVQAHRVEPTARRRSAAAPKPARTRLIAR